MGKVKIAYVVIADGSDPKKHRSEMLTHPGLEIISLAVSSYSQAVEVCRNLVEKEGVAMIELCPGFGNVGVGMVAEAVGDNAIVGVVRVDRLPVFDCKSGDTIFNK